MLHPDNGILALKRNELSSHGKTWKKLKFMLLSGRSTSVNATYCMISTIWHSGKDKNMVTVKRPVVARGEGVGRDELTENRGCLGQ